MSETTIDASAAGRVLAAKRRIGVRPCAVCGREMSGIARKRYCGNTCTVKAYRQRRREQIGTVVNPRS
jgi:hypothetical protein